MSVFPVLYPGVHMYSIFWRHYKVACSTVLCTTEYVRTGTAKAKGRELYCHTSFLTRKESFGDTAFIFFTTFTEKSKY